MEGNGAPVQGSPTTVGATLPPVDQATKSSQINSVNSLNSSGSSSKTLVTILLLFFFWPVGLILMWAWSGWKRSTKIIVSIIFLIFIILSIVGWVIIIAGMAKSGGLNSLTTPSVSQTGTMTQKTVQTAQTAPSGFGVASQTITDGTKYSTDSDGDSIPDFVETATGYNPNQDECLLASCGQGGVTAQKQTTNILFILDASGSMAETAGSQVKMTAAKNALKNLAASVPTSVNVGLMVYGYKGSNSTADKQVSCQSIDMFYPLSPMNPSTFNQAVD